MSSGSSAIPAARTACRAWVMITLALCISASWLDAIASGRGTADEVARTTGLSAGEVATALTLLELGGKVTVEEGMVRSTIVR